MARRGEFVGGEPRLAVRDIYGFRLFEVTRNAAGEAELAGVTYRQPVLPGVNVASCGIEGSTHSAPDASCTCGWYAYDEARRWATSDIYVPTVVRLSGRIVVCERGLKAEELEVVAVAMTGEPERDALLKELLATQPQIKIYATERELLAAHPPTEVDRPPLSRRQKLMRRIESRRTVEGSMKFSIILGSISVFLMGVSNSSRLYGIMTSDETPSGGQLFAVAFMMTLLYYFRRIYGKRAGVLIAGAASAINFFTALVLGQAVVGYLRGVPMPTLAASSAGSLTFGEQAAMWGIIGFALLMLLFQVAKAAILVQNWDSQAASSSRPPVASPPHSRLRPYLAPRLRGATPPASEPRSTESSAEGAS